jgi:hypothetical protein
MEQRGYLYVALATTLNIVLNALTFGRYLWLEGRVRGGVFRNWGRRFRHRPPRFHRPETEAELAAIVRDSRRIRLYGSAHSFNDGVCAEDTLVSLDRYSGVVWKDLANKRAAFKAGTRVRDVVHTLLQDKLAFKALPSHDAQSLAGILSTDVHGTGRDWGFVSESVAGLKVIDGRGEVRECRPGDDLFKAVVGGVGAAGVISEVVVQAVDRFDVEQRFEITDLSFVEANYERLALEHEHLSFYLFPFTGKCQISTWNRTPKKQSFLGPLREFVAISADALLAAWFGGLMAYAGLLPRLSSITHSIKLGTNLVLESNKAYNRTIYHLHQELEFTVPFEEAFEACRKFVGLYERMYREAPLPYTLFEVRFTPADHELTLIGAGRGRRSAWIDLVSNDSDGFEKYYAAAEALIKEIGARPHLGKFCQSLGGADMERLHGEHFTKFLGVVAAQDPENKFANDFTRRLFGG